ncbi:hypothetical protein cypCar_00012591 [Cyprinus carpio]|nr:hypothetical protein cypCar_00012591 [Cyprinus carpio]
MLTLFRLGLIDSFLK